MDPENDNPLFGAPQDPESETPGFTAPTGPPMVPISDADIQKQWAAATTKKMQGVVIELPSGLNVRAIRPNIFHLLQKGALPSALRPMVEKWMNLVKDGSSAEDIMSSIEEDITADPDHAMDRINEMIKFVFETAVIAPKFSSDGKPGTFDIEMVEMDDLYFIYQWAQGVDEALATFRRESQHLISSTQNGENVFDTAKQLLGIRRNDPGAGVAGVANQ